MSLLSAVCTFDGIWFKGRPRPPSGVLPMTVICGSSWAVAGLFGGPPDASAADAEIGIAAAARYINNPNCRIGLECANKFPLQCTRKGRTCGNRRTWPTYILNCLECTDSSRSAPLSARESSLEKRRRTRPEKFPAIPGFLPISGKTPDFDPE